MSLFAYDPQNSILIVAGYRVTQFADGTALTIEATDDGIRVDLDDGEVLLIRAGNGFIRRL